MARLQSFDFANRDAAFVWDVPPDEAFRELAEQYAKDLHWGVVRIVERWKPEIEQWMQNNAPWTDRTGDARKELFTDLENVVDQYVRLWVSHGPDIEYGVWLEIRFAGKFAIIAPALDHFGPKIWADVKRMVEGR